MTKPPYEQRTVTYATLGATQAPDLLQYPPRGARPLESRARIGHGDDRWRHAVSQLLTGGVYRGAGMAVQIIPAPRELADAAYTPVSFDAQGEPVQPAEVGTVEEIYTTDGERQLRSGDTIVVGLGVRESMLLPLPGRVVLLDERDDQVMYAVGTLPGHPFSGEESFTLERTADGSVWLTVRSFAKPANGLWWMLTPGLFLARRVIARRFLRALTGPLSPQRD